MAGAVTRVSATTPNPGIFPWNRESRIFFPGNWPQKAKMAGAVTLEDIRLLIVTR